MTRENGADRTFSIIDLNARLNILKNLNTELKLARQGNDRFGRQYYNSKSAESVENNRVGRAALSQENWTDWTLEWTGNYNATIGKHDIKVLGGYSYQQFDYRSFNAENMNFPSDAFGYNNLGAGLWQTEAGRLGMGSDKSREKTIAFLSRVNYSFDDTYFLTGIIRYEGNTKFGENNKWGLFPALSAAWRLSSLPVFQQEAIDDLKLRVSYGETGRSGFGRYTSLARYSAYGQYLNESGQWIRGYGPGNNQNADLRWERQKSYNLGLDFAFFQNKLSGSIDGFLRQSKDLLANYDVPLPPFLHEQMFVNVGTTSASGVELILNWNAVQGKDFRYTTNITSSYTKSKLNKFSSDNYTKGFIELGGLPSPGNPGNAFRLQDGVELGSFYGYKYAGVDEQGKMLIWKEAREGGDKILSTQTDPNRDKTYLGNGMPRYELTWGNTLGYKNFDLSLYFRGRFDYQILNMYQMYYGLVAESGTNLLRDAYDRNGHITSGKVISDYFLENGDFFRLDNVTLGWTPQLGIKHLSSLRLYGTVRNVFVMTKYSGLDPNTVNVTGLTPGLGGLDVYPITRNFSLGAQINF
jgi:TonB-dependent starch-binding outer membrane protein SusC